jgi:hypothetical protein
MQVGSLVAGGIPIHEGSAAHGSVVLMTAHPNASSARAKPSDRASSDATYGHEEGHQTSYYGAGALCRAARLEPLLRASQQHAFPLDRTLSIVLTRMIAGPRVARSLSRMLVGLSAFALAQVLEPGQPKAECSFDPVTKRCRTSKAPGASLQFAFVGLGKPLSPKAPVYVVLLSRPPAVVPAPGQSDWKLAWDACAAVDPLSETSTHTVVVGPQKQGLVPLRNGMSLFCVLSPGFAPALVRFDTTTAGVTPIAVKLSALPFVELNDSRCGAASKWPASAALALESQDIARFLMPRESGTPGNGQRLVVAPARATIARVSAPGYAQRTVEIPALLPGQFKQFADVCLTPGARLFVRVDPRLQVPAGDAPIRLVRERVDLPSVAEGWRLPAAQGSGSPAPNPVYVDAKESSVVPGKYYFSAWSELTVNDELVKVPLALQLDVEPADRHLPHNGVLVEPDDIPVVVAIRPAQGAGRLGFDVRADTFDAACVGKRWWDFVSPDAQPHGCTDEPCVARGDYCANAAFTNWRVGTKGGGGPSPKAIEFLRKGCAEGSARACAALPLSALENEPDKDQAQSQITPPAPQAAPPEPRTISTHNELVAALQKACLGGAAAAERLTALQPEAHDWAWVACLRLSNLSDPLPTYDARLEPGAGDPWEWDVYAGINAAFSYNRSDGTPRSMSSFGVSLLTLSPNHTFGGLSGSIDAGVTVLALPATNALTENDEDRGYLVGVGAAALGSWWPVEMLHIDAGILYSFAFNKSASSIGGRAGLGVWLLEDHLISAHASYVRVPEIVVRAGTPTSSLNGVWLPFYGLSYAFLFEN